MRRIVIDAMGSDSAPGPELDGAILAVRERLAEVVLVGPQDVLRRELARRGARTLDFEIVQASQVVTMEDAAAKAFRHKKDSTIRVAARLVRDGKADGLVSAGNTGAVMATAKITLGVLEGVDRPALAAVMPNLKGTATIVLDVGANVDCTAENLEQFAVMGEIYYRAIFGVPRPRVGLLSNGEEAHKGNELVRQTHQRLKQLPLNFIGNVEGRDVINGKVDVMVADGFTGNVVLKASEGVAIVLAGMLKEALASTVTAKLGSVLALRALRRFKKRVDYSEYGGAPLLGVRGVCIITHGGSNANGIKNAIRVASEFVAAQVNGKIQHELAEASARGGQRAAS
ncbi:MAG: phosphate acyltransferase PlsX [Terriglobia bacterium]|jgi:glycerol-3-phosphate acyltransferase PlsX